MCSTLKKQFINKQNEAEKMQGQIGEAMTIITKVSNTNKKTPDVSYFDQSVNVTLGAPFIRTSVDHGTAFDIAYKNKAKSINMLTAINCAIKMSNNS